MGGGFLRRRGRERVERWPARVGQREEGEKICDIKCYFFWKSYEISSFFSRTHMRSAPRLPGERRRVRYVGRAGGGEGGAEGE